MIFRVEDIEFRLVHFYLAPVILWNSANWGSVLVLLRKKDKSGAAENMPEEACGAGKGLSERKLLGSLEGGEMGNKEVSKVVENGGGGEVSEREVQQQLVQGPAVRWDRFLPFRSLKVLLVENDDCTRQVVSALLRNCSYEVVAVANGVQAWRYLEDLTNHTDLILAEVVMPIISGIGLLYKIMNHKTFKNIPVIMMSSHDSMGIVFKCLSRGAVDFLVKPIRKNELKNLWQHVWRRCHSSSGSGSESGIMSRKSVRSNRSDIPDDSYNSREHENVSLGSRSDEDDVYESRAQSSWSKMAAEIGSPQPTTDESNDAPDGTCAQVIHTKPDPVCNGRENVNVPEENEGQKERFGACQDRSLEQGNLRQYLSENPTTGQNKLPELDSSDKQKTEIDSANGRFNKENQYADIIGTITASNMHVEENTIAALNGATECSCNDKVKVGPADLPVVGLNSGKDSCRYTCGPSLFQDSQEDGRIIFPANNGLVATGTPVKLTYPSPSSSNHIQLVSGIIDKNGGNVTSNPDRPGPIVRTIWAVAQGPSRKGSICAVASLLCFPFCHQESSSETLCFFFHFICFGHSPNEGAAVATTNEHEPANSVNVHRHTTTLSQAER